MAKKKGGRPQIPIKWDMVNQYLKAQCTGASIARMIGIHPETLYDRCVEEFGEEYGISNFSEYSALKKEEGKDLLKAAQFQKAMGGDTTMQIWLGKNLLNQTDKQDLSHKGIPPNVQINVTSKANAKKLDEFLNGKSD